ncbi:hypothetical protein ACFOSC_25340 [Streptantibioticus rubrisoli]|uniref:Uncharacterized protein n=1 Tax=Streptantibioticus rubrisoli TaxID=1387313 RepID=A0ABT1PFL0_9ACTN|nr:hypothetical protein [Streptantibioticus rubrisoli]MCQ4044150.1 hypothetical protein [Streptantibioticus rubrisoli]
MSASPSTPPPGPDKRPYGTVRLAAPVPPAAPRRPVPPVSGRWYGPRVVIPLLSIETLRGIR